MATIAVANPTVSVERLGCKPTHNPGVNNAALINAAMLDRTKKHAYYFPGDGGAGRWIITEPIVVPGMSGYRLIGNGFSGPYAITNYFGDTTIGGPCTRIEYKNAPITVDPLTEMLRIHGYGGVCEGMQFEGSQNIVLIGATQASPIVCTTNTPHGYSNGDVVVVFECGATAGANGKWTISNVTSTTFSLNGSTGSAGPGGGFGYVMKEPVVVGIHLGTFNSQGSRNTSTGKWCFRDIGFWNIQTAILIGEDMKFLDADSYSAETNNNSDECDFRNIRFMYPYDNNPSNQLRTCVRVRNNQAVDHIFDTIRVTGNPDHIFYFERAGKTRINSCLLSGATGTDANKPVIFLRVGKGGPYDFVMNCAVDGSTGGSGQVGHNWRLLQIDRSSAEPRTFKLDCDVGVQTHAVPIVIARGGANIMLRITGRGMIANSLKLLGSIESSEERVVNVHIHDSVLRNVAWPSDLITTDSTGPFRVTWSNCVKSNSNSQDGVCVPFTNGAVASGDPGTPWSSEPVPGLILPP